MLETLGSAVTRDPERARAALEGSDLLPERDKLAQLLRGFWSQGIILRIPDGVRLAKPVVLRWAAGVPGRALIGRTIVELGEGAEASVVEELVESGPAIDCAEGETVPQSLLATSTEVRLGRGSTLGFASLQELGRATVAMQQRTGVVGDAATLSWAFAQIGGRLVRGRVDNRIVGDRASLKQVEIVFGTEDQLVDLTTYTRHIGRDTTGDVLSKGALRDRARLFLKGMAIIERSAVGTDSFLGEYGMNLSKATRSVAIPSLEIDQPDCRRAAHSSSVGPIDDSQVFYLESRGIPDDEARKFIVLGYLEPVVARVPLESAQEHLRAVLSAKWDGTAADVTEAA